MFAHYGKWCLYQPFSFLKYYCLYPVSLSYQFWLIIAKPEAIRIYTVTLWRHDWVVVNHTHTHTHTLRAWWDLLWCMLCAKIAKLPDIFIFIITAFNSNMLLFLYRVTQELKVPLDILVQRWVILSPLIWSLCLYGYILIKHEQLVLWTSAPESHSQHC